MINDKKNDKKINIENRQNQGHSLVWRPHRAVHQSTYSCEFLLKMAAFYYCFLLKMLYILRISIELAAFYYCFLLKKRPFRRSTSEIPVNINLF